MNVTFPGHISLGGVVTCRVPFVPPAGAGSLNVTFTTHSELLAGIVNL